MAQNRELYRAVVKHVEVRGGVSRGARPGRHVGRWMVCG